MNDFIVNLNTISLEVFVGALIVFLLTMLVKLPIKKTTAKFDENKRKAINTVIVFIPLILSVVLCVGYYLVLGKKLYFESIITNGLSVYVLSLSIYAIFARLWVIIKSVISGKKSFNSTEIKAEIDEVKNSITNLSSKFDFNLTGLDEIVKKIDILKNLKKSMTVDENGLSLVTFEDIDSEIEYLEAEKAKFEQN